MTVGGRRRLGIALHVVVNLCFGAVAVVLAATAEHETRLVAPAAASEPVMTEAGSVVTSTGYCLDGTTASGARVGPGQAAMNSVQLGTKVRLLAGPLAGSLLVVTDRIGHGTELDIWFDDCERARSYGRREVVVLTQMGG